MVRWWARGACHRARIRATRWLSPPYDSKPRSRILAVAVLVLLAASAGTILVAADLAPSGGILRVAVGGGRGHQGSTGERQFVFAGVWIELVRFHRRQFGL